MLVFIVIFKRKRKILENYFRLTDYADTRKIASLCFQVKCLTLIFVRFRACYSVLKSHAVIWRHCHFSLHFSFLCSCFLFSTFSALSISHKLFLHTTVLQLSPEEGYVSAKEDAFLCPPHPCKEPGLPDKALFRATLALVSGHQWSSIIFKFLWILVFQNIVKLPHCIYCFMYLEAQCAHIALNESTNCVFDTLW